MLVVGHLKQRHLESDIRCDRASVLGNPFELINEESRPAVLAAHKAYLKLVIKHKNSGFGHLVVEPSQVGVIDIPTSEKWKRPTVDEIISALENLVPKYKSERVYRLMCWCRRDDAENNLPACHCDSVIACIKKWSDK
ncbi:MAG: hypothetical protein RLZZ139_769 [Cyanobacteriota bacterium]|jgi:hypothetical protein